MERALGRRFGLGDPKSKQQSRGWEAQNAEGNPKVGIGRENQKKKAKSSGEWGGDQAKRENVQARGRTKGK